MIQTPIRRTDFRTLWCGLVLALGAACGGTGAGKIPCRDTTNCPGDFPTCSVAGFCVNSAPAARMDIVSGDAQSAVVANPLGQSLVVKVSDTNGNAVQGFNVAWTAATGAGQVSTGTTSTGPDGKASITATLGTVAGAYTFTASGSGLTGSPRTFTASGIPDVATNVALTGFPTPVTAGTPGPLTATAQDKFNNTAAGYRGTVHFTSTNTNTTLPGDYTFTADDNGVHGFSATLKRASSISTFSITATDTVTAAIAGSQTGISVNPDVAVALDVSGFTSPVTAGASGFVVVKAVDAFANTATGYLGTVQITSNDGAALLPANHTFLVTDAGVHTFAVTLKTANAAASITGKDTVTASITGNQTPIVVNPGATTNLLVTGFANPASADTGGSVTVTAADANNNPTPAYRGTIQFTSDNPNTTLPGDYTFTAGDNGTHTFAGVVLKKASPPNYSITATDTLNASITGSQILIVVNPGATTKLLVTGYPNPASAVTGGSVTVTAADANDNTTPAYTGTVQFTSDNPNRIIPLDYTFLVGDNGTRTFAGVVLKKASPPNYSITVTDGSFTGSQTGIVVNPGSATALTVAGFPNPAVAGAPGSVTVTVLDANGNTVTGYPGTVSITSDVAATLPGPHTFVGSDNGVHTFPVTLKTASVNSSIFATGTGPPTITGKQTGIVVQADALVFGATASVIAGGLRSGLIFIAGGNTKADGSGSTLGKTWFYNPANSALTAGPTLAAARAFHTATAFGVGQVLAAGGNSTVIEVCNLDAATPTCTDTTAALASARCNAAAALVTIGPPRVLIAGGDDCATPIPTALATWDLWDSTTAGSAVHNAIIHPLNALRRQFTATVVGVGKVLLAGGAATATADLFTLNAADLPNSGVVATAGPMQIARSGHTATLLTSTTTTTACPTATASSSCVLIAGGNATPNKTWEIYDASTNTFPRNATTAGNHDLQNPARAFHAAAAFGNGKVLLAGGTDAGGALNTSEAFDPTAVTLGFLGFGPGGGLQLTRQKAAAAYAQAQDLLVLIGGNAVGPSTEQVTAP